MFVRLAGALLVMVLLVASAPAEDKQAKADKAAKKEAQAVTAASLVTKAEAEKLLGAKVRIDEEQTEQFSAATYGAQTDAPSLVVQMKPNARKEYEQLKEGFKQVAQAWKDVGDDAFFYGSMAVMLKKDNCVYFTVTADPTKVDAKFQEALKKLCKQAAERIR
jgi:hypothetical protein